MVPLVTATLALLFAVAGPSSAAAPPGAILVGCDSPAYTVNDDVCVMGPDGSDLTSLTKSSGPFNAEGSPAGSPDGTRIAYIRNRDLWIMSFDGSGQRALTNSATTEADPAWSPDGSRIIFGSDRDGNSEIYAINPDGTNLTRLTTDPAADRSPTWSPDGSRIAFSSARDGNDEIYVMNPDGSSPTNLTGNAGADSSPAWSPDSSRIAFTSVRGGVTDIYVMVADGTGQANLTHNPDATRFSLAPDWSLDGRQLVYRGPEGIYVMNADGTGTTRIGPAVDFRSDPDWAPSAFLPAPTTTTTTMPVPPPVVLPPATFAPATNLATGSFNPWQTAVGDFNGDRIPDLVVATPVGAHPEFNQGGELVVLLGTGGGRFGPPSHFAAGQGPRSVAVGDLNRDGKADLVAASAGGGGTADVQVLLGAGNGTFAPPVSLATGTIGRPHFLVLDDLNGDGFADIAMVSFGSPPDGGDLAVLLGTGTGGFGPATLSTTGFGTTSVAAGDFNGDGVKDLVITNLLGNEVGVLLGTGGGRFGALTRMFNDGNPNHVAVADLNRDGFVDLVVTGLKGSVSIYLGAGTGTFGTFSSYPAGSRPWSAAVADLNGDGFDDLAVADAEEPGDVVDDDHVSILLGTGTGTFGEATTVVAGNSPYFVAASDLNGDGRPDLAVANNFSKNVSVLLNTTGGDRPPPDAPVASVSGGAYGYFTDVSLVGTPSSTRGPAPSVTLGPAGGTQTATDPDGAAAVYGPAEIFEARGPMTASTIGTTGPQGQVTSSAWLSKVGPGPFTADSVFGTCTASGTATGSTTFTNARVVLEDPDPSAQGEAGERIVQVPVHPAPNTEYSGRVNLGALGFDSFRIVFNEQAAGGDGLLTVNAVHQHLLGPNAVGEAIIGQARCGVVTAAMSGPTLRPLSPARVWDSRFGPGPTGRVGPGEARTISVTGVGGVPASGVTAVVLNVTAVNPTAATYVTAWPAGEAKPLASNLNVPPNDVRPNLVIVKVGAGGQVSLANAAGSVDLIADVAGWYGLAGGQRYNPVSPARVWDSRFGPGPTGRVGPGETRTISVTGVGGVPASGVTAVVLNVTAVNPTAATYVTAWPAGEAKPLASNLNVPPNDVRPNLVIVKVGAGGQVSLANDAGSLDLIADVAGWYGATGSALTVVTPARVWDSRFGPGPTGRVGPGEARTISVTGVGGVPASGVTAVVLNVTAVNPTAATYVTAWPAGEAKPLASNLNVPPNDVRPNLVIVKVGAGGQVSVANDAGSLDLIADVAGWYGAPV